MDKPEDTPTQPYLRGEVPEIELVEPGGDVVATFRDRRMAEYVLAAVIAYENMEIT